VNVLSVRTLYPSKSKRPRNDTAPKTPEER